MQIYLGTILKALLFNHFHAKIYLEIIVFCICFTYFYMLDIGYMLNKYLLSEFEFLLVIKFMSLSVNIKEITEF